MSTTTKIIKVPTNERCRYHVDSKGNQKSRHNQRTDDFVNNVYDNIHKDGEINVDKDDDFFSTEDRENEHNNCSTMTNNAPDSKTTSVHIPADIAHINSYDYHIADKIRNGHYMNDNFENDATKSNRVWSY